MKITATEEYGLKCVPQLALRPGEIVSLADLAHGERSTRKQLAQRWPLVVPPPRGATSVTQRRLTS